MGRVRRIKLATLTAAADGTATGTTNPIAGEILGFYVNYSASCASGTDLTITGPNGQGNLLFLENTKTDAFVPVRTNPKSTINGDLTYDGTYKVVIPFPVHGPLSLAVAENTEGETIDIEVLYRE